MVHERKGGVSRETRERLEHDATFARTVFESLLGPPAKENVSPKGWVTYPCPSPECRDTHTFGVHYSDPIGGFNCFKCGLKGAGFTTLCARLGEDPSGYLSGDREASPREKPRRVLIQRETAAPLSPENFGAVWQWVQRQAVLEYGPENHGLSPKHASLLEERGLTIRALPPWFTIPNGDLLARALARWGTTLCERAQLYKAEEDCRTLFAAPDRIALVYPTAAWAEKTVTFGHLRTYNIECRTDKDRKLKVLSAADYATGTRPYIRARPEDGPLPWGVCEGEVKTEAWRHAGLPALGLPGMTTAHPAVAALIVKSLRETNYLCPSSVVVCLDTEPTARQQARTDATAQRLIDTITDEVRISCDGYLLPIHRLKLPARPGHKADVDSCLRQASAKVGLEAARKSFRRLVLETAQAGPR